ncbi:MAG: hypothetical protein VXW65_14950 [Pseudomonadota bacterium]|nr:hypothetical protein [Pseudomonadota bacterium]
MSHQHTTPRLGYLALTVSALFLAACGGSDSRPATNTKPPAAAEQHDAGRLAVVNAEADSKQLHIWSLDQNRSLHQVTLADPVTALYPSPDRRYTMVVQRPQGMIRFIDSGYELEPHGDHFHQSLQKIQLLNFTLQGTTPAHVNQFEQQVSIFFDGHRGATEPVTTPYAPAQIQVLTDQLIAKSASWSHTLPTNMHASAETRGDYLLAPRRDTSIEPYNPLPTHIDLYRRDGTGFTLSKNFITECPAIHGSASIEDYSVFACSDGVLVIGQDGDQFFERKIMNPVGMLKADGKPARIGSFTAHHALDTMVGKADESLYAVNPADNNIQKIDWLAGDSANPTAKALSYKIDPSGHYLVILDNLGRIHVLDAEDDFKVLARINAISSMPESGTPAWAFSQHNHDLFISDAAQKTIQVIDLKTQELKSSIALGFAPAQVTWLGWTQEEHQH